MRANNQLKIFFFVILNCALCYATAHIQMTVNTGTILDQWPPTPRNNIGLFTSIFFVSPGGTTPLPGFPKFPSVDIREIDLSGTYWGAGMPLQLEQGFKRKGMVVHTTYADASIEMESYAQTYTYTDYWNAGTPKDFTLEIKAYYYVNGKYGNDPGNPLSVVQSVLRWAAGTPQYVGDVGYNNSVDKSGYYLRVDMDPYDNAAHSGFEMANNDHLDYVPWPTLNATMWNDANYKVLGRFFDTEWRTESTSQADCFWVREFKNTTHDFYFGTRNDNYCYAMDARQGSEAAFNAQRTMGGSPKLPFFAAAGKGQNQVYYLYASHNQQNNTTASWSYNSLYMQKNIGMRSLLVQWYFQDAEYGDYNYEVNRNGVSNSLITAFAGKASVPSVKGLMYEASGRTTSDLFFSRFQKTLVCPTGTCTDQDLYAMEYANNPHEYFDYKRLKTAVYVLGPNQVHYSSTPTKKTEGIVYGGRSRAFVFPASVLSKAGYSIKERVYLCIAHELGHTLGMNHQWSNCNLSDNWDGKEGTFNCNQGTIMSYSTNKTMQFHPDEIKWYANAPFSWISPRWGYGPVYDNSLEPKTLLNWITW